MSTAVAQSSAWTSYEEALLMGLYPHTDWAQILEALSGRSKCAIWNRAHRLGLKRERHEFSPETREKLAGLVRERKPRLGKVVYPVVERDGIPSKCCSKCGEWLPLGRFAKQPDCSGGVRNICTTCEGRQAYAKHRDAKIAAVRRYQKRHPEKYKLHKQVGNRRRHGRKMAGRGISASEWRSILKIYGGLCAYCKEAKADTMDHVLPLSRGGQHDIGNILPACKACNFSKHNYDA